MSYVASFLSYKHLHASSSLKKQLQFVMIDENDESLQEMEKEKGDWAFDGFLAIEEMEQKDE